MFFEIQGVEVGIKTRSKINIKNHAETEKLRNPILIGFWSILDPSWPPKTEPRRSKIDVEMPSKFDTSLKASWNAIFSAKMRQDARGSPAGMGLGVGPAECAGRLGRIKEG